MKVGVVVGGRGVLVTVGVGVQVVVAVGVAVVVATNGIAKFNWLQALRTRIKKNIDNIQLGFLGF